MRFIITTIVMAFISSGAVAQPNYYDIKIRELYDDMFTKNMQNIDVYYKTGVHTSGTPNEYFAHNIANGSINDNGKTENFEILSAMLMSLNEMYEATGDIGYLYKFMFHSRRLTAWRGKYFGASPYGVLTSVSKGWVTNPDKTYMDGLMYLAFARFAWLIKKSYAQQLYNLQINPLNHSDFWFMNGYSTFGQYANYLEIEAKDYYVYMLQNNFLVHKYQIGLDNHPNRIGTISNLANHNNVAEFGFTKYSTSGVMNLNMQLIFFAGMAYLYDINNSYYSFKDRVQQAVNLFNKNRIIYDIGCNGFSCSSCNYSSSYIVSGNMIGKYVLVDYTSNNSYYWYYQGWNEHKDCIWECSSQNCSGFCSSGYAPPYNDFDQVEDIGHAYNDYEFIFALNETEFRNYSGVLVYPDNEMLKYRNTILKNVWKGGSKFSNKLDGTDLFYHNGNCVPVNDLAKRVFVFAKLRKWDYLDANSTSIYSVLMSHYSNSVQDYNSVIWSPNPGQYFVGVARMLKAQYDNQCPNLHLRNRILTYDQDFAIKHDLIVDANRSLVNSSGNVESIFHPKTSNSEFIIESGVESNFIAGHSVKFWPGFHAKTGSHVTASINGGLCSGARSSDIYLDVSGVDNKEPSTNSEVLINDFTPYYQGEILQPRFNTTDVHLYPNPAFGNNMTIELTGDGESQAHYFIMDVRGVHAKEGKLFGGENSININLNTGCYIVKCVGADFVKCFKLTIK